MDLLNRIRRSLAQRGWSGTARMYWVYLKPGTWAREATNRRIDEEFDRRHDVDTGGDVSPGPADVIGQNWKLSNRYAAVGPAEFSEGMSHVSLAYPEFTFIDFGSGKGRGLLLASELPFRKIIGVEFCPELNRIARQNLRRYPAAARRNGDIEIVDADAATFRIPSGPLLLFLNNPFAEALMSKVAQNVADAFRRETRRIVVLYFWPFHANIWDEAGFLKRIRQTPAIFDTDPITPPAQARPPVSRRVKQSLVSGSGDGRYHS